MKSRACMPSRLISRTCRISKRSSACADDANNGKACGCKNASQQEAFEACHAVILRGRASVSVWFDWHSAIVATTRQLQLHHRHQLLLVVVIIVIMGRHAGARSERDTAEHLGELRGSKRLERFSRRKRSRGYAISNPHQLVWIGALVAAPAHRRGDCPDRGGAIRVDSAGQIAEPSVAGDQGSPVAELLPIG
jgi:hypothetical protein